MILVSQRSLLYMGRIKDNFTIRLDRELKRKVGNYAIRNNCTMTDVVVSSLNAYLVDDDNWTMLFGRINRMRKAITNLERRIEMMIELMLLQLQYWFTLTPELTNEEFKQMKQRGDVQFTKFIDIYKNSLMKGGILQEDFQTYFTQFFEKVDEDD